MSSPSMSDSANEQDSELVLELRIRNARSQIERCEHLLETLPGSAARNRGEQVLSQLRTSLEELEARRSLIERRQAELRSKK